MGKMIKEIAKPPNLKRGNPNINKEVQAKEICMEELYVLGYSEKKG